jgi:hypothetical protein
VAAGAVDAAPAALADAAIASDVPKVEAARHTSSSVPDCDSIHLGPFR